MPGRVPEGERLATVEATLASTKQELDAAWLAIEGIRKDISSIKADINRAIGGLKLLIYLGAGLAGLMTIGKGLFPALAVLFKGGTEIVPHQGDD